MFFNCNAARPLATAQQVAELNCLGFRGPASYLYRDEADSEIYRLRRLRRDEHTADRYAAANPLQPWYQGGRG